MSWVKSFLATQCLLGLWITTCDSQMFERCPYKTCSTLETSTGESAICGRRLTTYLLRRCEHGMYIPSNGKRSGSKHDPQINSTHQKPHKQISANAVSFNPHIRGGIFQSKERAGNFLEQKRSTYSEACRPRLHCECCVYRCTTNEMRGYCNTNKRRKRSMRGKREDSGVIDDESVDAFYKSLEHVDEDESPTLTVEELEHLPIVRALEMYKQINTERKMKAAANGKRESTETDIEEPKKVLPYKVLRLKELLKQKLMQRLTESHSEASTSTIPEDNSRSTGSRSILDQIRKLLAEEDERPA